MRITIYKTELSDERLNVLIKEKACNYSGAESLNSPSLIAEMLNSVFCLDRQAEEYLYMIAMDTKGKPIGVFEVSHGTVDGTLCNPREIFIKALLCGASAVVVAHNHPSGDITPSKQDVASFKRLKEAGKLLGVELWDSIIVGAGCYCSLEELRR